MVRCACLILFAAVFGFGQQQTTPQPQARHLKVVNAISAVCLCYDRAEGIKSAMERVFDAQPENFRSQNWKSEIVVDSERGNTIRVDVTRQWLALVVDTQKATAGFKVATTFIGVTIVPNDSPEAAAQAVIGFMYQMWINPQLFFPPAPQPAKPALQQTRIASLRGPRGRNLPPFSQLI